MDKFKILEMAANTKIEWTDHTYNFWTGCHKVSPGCKFCYMFRDMERYGKKPTEVLRVKYATQKKVLKAAKPGDKIFVNSWSDFFIEEGDQWRDDAWNVIRSRPDLHWQILTKRPERIFECLPDDWGDGWDHVWIGVSVENDQMAKLRIPILNMIKAKTKFLSIEPLIGPVHLHGSYMLEHVDWVIIGGESGNENGKYKYRPCELVWIENIVRECVESNVPVFVKQLGTYLSNKHELTRHGKDMEEFPMALKVRQFPKLKNNG